MGSSYVAVDLIKFAGVYPIAAYGAEWEDNGVAIGFGTMNEVTPDDADVRSGSPLLGMEELEARAWQTTSIPTA